MSQNLKSCTEYDASEPGLRQAYAGLLRLPLTVVASRMAKAINQGGILRSAEAFRVQEVIYEREFDRATDLSGGSGIWDYQPHRFVEHAEDALEVLRAQRVPIYGLTLAPDAVAVQDFEWDFPCALLLGEERDGIRETLLPYCEEFIAIPLYGMVKSINVANAATLAFNFAASAFAAKCPQFQPARNASRELKGLEPVTYLGE